MAISLKQLLRLGTPPPPSSLRTFLARNHPGVFSFREAARRHGLQGEDLGPVRTTSVVFVRKDATTLARNAFMTIAFNPSNGPALFNARGSKAPPDAVIGGDVGQANGLFGEAIRPPDRRRVAAAAVPLGADAAIDALKIAEPRDIVIDDGVTLPPLEPKPRVRLQVFRETKPGAVLTHEFTDLRAARLAIDDVPVPPVGFAPEQWRAVFTNISPDPIQCFARVQFRERRRLAATALPTTLLNRMLRQAVGALGLELVLAGDTVRLDFAPSAREMFDLRPIEKQIGFSVFGDVHLTSTSVVVGDTAIPGESGRFPRIRVTVEFEESGPELSIDLGVGDVDLQLSGLRFEIDAVLRNRVFPGAGNGHLRGDFPWIPFITADISLHTDVRFSSRALGIARKTANALLDAVDAAVFIASFGKKRIKERIPTLREALIDAGNELAASRSFALSNYIQVALQIIVDRDATFHGLRMAGSAWEVVSGPIPPPQPGDGGGVVLIPDPAPLRDATPIDGPQPAADTAALQRIDHVVVLMLENRSYDHVLGYLTHPDHGNRPEFDGLTGAERNRIEGLADAVPTPMTTTKFFPSPPHEFEPVAQQVGDGEMSGFGEAFKVAIESKNQIHDPRSIMNFHVRGQLPVYDRLVADFAVARRWFAALPGPTFPNRLCAIAGATAFLNNGEIPRDRYGYLDAVTIFDVLSEGGIEWRYYEHDLAFLRMVGRHRLDTRHIRPIDRFDADARAGLPPVTFIDPNFVDVPSEGVANDDHPAGADMISGQRLVADVINAVMASPGWPNTLLVVTYDEHGGFFDHVPPPGSARNPFAGVFRVHPKAPAMLGVRVPAFVVSPRARPGAILERIFDHTSVLKSILVRFLPGQQHRLGRRVETAAHLGGAIPLDPPREGIAPFAVPPAAPLAPREVLEPGSFHAIISSLGNPFNQKPATLARLTPRF